MDRQNAGVRADLEIEMDHGELAGLMARIGPILAGARKTETARRAVRLLGKAAQEHFELEESAVPAEDQALFALQEAHLGLAWMIEDLERSAGNPSLRNKLFSDFLKAMEAHETQVDEPIFGRMAA